MEVTPRPYQRIALRAALKGLRGKSKRALVVLATGLGKTLAAAFITKEFRAKRTLFLVHNNFILDHAVHEFRLVFSGKTRMAIYNGMSKNGAAESDIVFATWQTMGKSLQEWVPTHFDLIIVDEAHHSEADTYKPVLKYFTGPKLGITATPDREDKADIREVFGPEVIDITLEEAIARGWLPRIEYHVITDESLDDDALQKIAAEIREGKKRFTMAEVNRRIFIKKRDEEVAKIINGYNEKAVIFCASIVHAERMVKALNLAATFHSSKGNGQKDTWRKNQVTLGNLKNGVIRRVCAVNAFNEGVDVPSIGLVAFCRVTGVLTIFRQQLGRGLRPGKDKLIVLDFVGNLERIQLVLEMMNKISDLHEKHALQKDREREGYTRQRFEVSGKGFEFTFSDKVVDLMKVLEYCEREFFPTWQEASAAAIKLGVKSKRDYADKYLSEPHLPSNPAYTYASFPGWQMFLSGKDRNFYTYSQAIKVVQKMGIKTQSQYDERKKEDGRLPGYPPDVYKDKWQGWPNFFGKEPKKFCRTWRIAARIVRSAGVRSRTEYLALCNKDKRLPRSPWSKYPDFPGFPTFLKVGQRPYRTWQQAARAAKKIGATTCVLYKKLRHKDPRLYSNPIRDYKDCPDWNTFLGKEAKNFYTSWQMARKSAIALGIKKAEEYVRLYKNDPRLPSNPSKAFWNFPGWVKFLGKK